MAPNARKPKIGLLRQGFVILAMRLVFLITRLPFKLQLRLGKGAGALAWHLFVPRRRVAVRNIELCMPELTHSECVALARRHFEAIGASIPETAMAWSGRSTVIRSLIQIDGREHLETALERGRGVILYSAHFTTIELSFPAMKPLCPLLAGMYKAQRNPAMTRIMNQGRRQSGDELIASTNVRGIFRSLRRNAVVWYAADQSYSGRNSALVPFFGEPAMTNTAIWKIARSTNATVLPYFSRRLPDDSGYILTIGPPLDDFPGDDAVADVTRLVRVIEEQIRLCPEQYWWIHKRFKGRPAPYPDVYQPSASVRQVEE